MPSQDPEGITINILLVLLMCQKSDVFVRRLWFLSQKPSCHVYFVFLKHLLTNKDINSPLDLKVLVLVLVYCYVMMTYFW